MLEELESVCTLEDVTTLGYDLLQGEGFITLQTQLRNKGVCFSPADYWTKEDIDRKVHTLGTLPEILRVIREESDDSPRILHTLQVVGIYCPAAHATIQRLLKKCTPALK